MITLQLFNNGLYLTESGFADPDNARVGFLLANPPSPAPPSIQLTSTAWNNGDADVLGYFAFFVPLSTLPPQTRNWGTFGPALLKLFQSQPNTNQFGWINESPGNDPTLNGTQILVQRDSGITAQNSFNLTFLNVSLEVSFSPFSQPAISFDEGQNAFLFDNSGQIVSLAAQPPGGGGQQSYPSTSANLTLPLDGANAGAAGAAFQLDINGLAQFETGLLYVAPPSTIGGNLTSLKYQVLRLPGTKQQQLSFNAWFDVLGPLDGTRTFLQFSDQQVSSYFADTSGNTFALTTTSSGAPTDISRLVFANRVFQATTDQSYYYLTPAGTFQLSIDGVASPVLPGGYARMLCGTTGTEFLQTTVTGPTLDSVSFVPNQAAYAPPPAPQSNADAGSSPSFLSNCDGNVTTSWVQFNTTSGNYVSQPEQSPLFNQGKNSTTTSVEGVPPGFQVYVLDFLPLPTWAPPAPPPPGYGLEAEAAAPTSAPPVPLVPYAGINSTNDPNFNVAPFIDIESKALNPTRKNRFSNATLIQTKAAPQAEQAALGAAPDSLAMTPQGLLAGLQGTPPAPQVWVTTEIAQSPSGILQITNMQEEIRQTLQQNLIFAVISTTKGGTTGTLFDFAGDDQTIDIADWFFSLSPDGTPSSDKVPVPPILILKFYDNMSIADLVGNVNLWSKADTFNDANKYSATQAQGYLQEVIQQACESVYGAGKCPEGVPSGQPDTSSLYYDFYQKVTDPQFSGIISVNCNIQLNNLPPAIKGVLGGMTTVNEQGERVSNIAAFRAHHVGVQINNTRPSSDQPALEQSALFGLVDYEKPAASSNEGAAPGGLDVFYNYEVEYLRALFANAELRQFACKINLTINNLFTTDVTLDTGNTKGPMLLAAGEGDGDGDNIVVITGSYQAHSTSDDDKSSGQGMYSFTAEGNFVFNFAPDNPYLDNITLTKLQFSFQQETPTNDSKTTTLTSRFAIWGSMVFKKFNDPDIFSFKQLVFADLGIGVTFNLTLNPPAPPVTSLPTLTFSPGDLRFDIAQSTPRDDDDSMLKLLPFKLKSFLYSEKADQTLDSLNYYTLSSVEGLSGVTDTFNYALIFDLDLGSMGALVGSLAAFQFSVIIGWRSGTDGGIAFGVQLPQADGKLEIKIQGVLTLSIALFQLKYVDYTPKGGQPQKLLVVVLHDAYMEVLGVRMPPGTGLIDFALFVPSDKPDKIGWLAAYKNGQSGVGGNGGGGEKSLHLAEGAAGAWEYIGSEAEPEVRPAGLLEDEGGNGNGGNGNGNNGDDKPVFELVYLGGGQRVGPEPATAPTNFKDFLAYMEGDFWTEVAAGNYTKVYHPDSNWLIIADFKLLGIIEVGFIFYDSTPFYSLMLNVTGFFEFEITYTKISDTIGMFYANLALPESLRTFQVGAASLTLPSIAVTVYTNGNWKLDVGFPKGDDWSRCFQVQAQAGPVPVTGAGGFYIASLSSATDDIFVNQYPSILAFGLAARLGVGKDFTSGPLSAGVSVTFFGIIEGAAGYLSSGANEIFKKPDALMLKGQFGLIGQIYGKIDFKIITASLNVTLSASVGIQLMLESNVPGRDGSLLLYVEASVKVSVSLSINLGLFSISISFTFKASFHFQWEMTIGGGANDALRAGYLALASVEEVSPLSLCPGLNAGVTLWMLPELTVVFPGATAVGAPWFACSLGIEYDPQPPASPTPGQYKPFETVTAQLSTWALNHVGAATGCSGTVSIEQLTALDSDATLPLVNWIDYDSLLGQLGVFAVTVTNATAPAGTQLNATAFPMFPFFKLQTKGRLKGTTVDDLNYQFSSQNPVSQTYVEQLQEYFNQLYVNQTRGGSGNQNLLETPEDSTTPLVQEIFLDYFTGLIRGGVHQLLQTMQDLQAQQGSPISPMALDKLIQTAIGGGYFANLAGQMSSSFRGGLRLPYAAGMTVPGGAPQTTDNPLYALLWQEFPVENTTNGQYTISLSNPDTTQKWVTSNASYVLTDALLKPYQGLTASDLTEPSAPSQIPFTNSGPQAFSFQNATTWTQPQGAPSSLRPFPSNLQQLQGAMQAPISVLVQSRQTGLPYLPGGTPLGTSAFTWATMITLNIRQVPGAQVQGSAPTMLKDVFALSGASQQDQQLLQQLLDVLKGSDPISNIQVLYQTSAGASGLSSDAVNAADVFVLRTNTTTVSVPPAGPDMLFLAEAPPPSDVPVGAQIDDHSDFIQIIQQAAVTNAPGYYLRYLNTSGNSLPTALFTNGPAPVTLLVTYNADGTGNTRQSPARVQPYYNAVVLSNATAGLLYYADTTDPALDTQYSVVAPGSVGVELTRAEGATLIQPSAAFAAAHKLKASQDYTLGHLITALQASGVNDSAQMLTLLNQAGAVPAQLNALYSLITYRVEQSTGFIASNLSAPIQAQQPDDGSTNTTHDYRVFVPLYNLAVDNQGALTSPPDRYASINDPFAIDFYLNDAFGNQLTLPSGFNGTNFYFDPITPVAEWLGVGTTFDFLAGTGAQANTFSVYLTPSPTAFQQLSADQIASTLQLYYSIRDQINGPGVSFYVETNLALQQDGTMAQVTLPTSQGTQIVQMVEAIITYLQTAQPNAPPSTPINVPRVTLTLTLQQGAALPSLFDIAVLFGIQREPSLISPTLFKNGVLIYPPAQNVSSSVSPTVGSSNETGTASVPITEFAGYFVQAFSTLTLAVGLGGAQQAPTQLSSAARALAQARALALNESGALTASSGTSGTSGSAPQSLWAVQSVLLDISIGTSTPKPGPLYMSPMPLDNTLNTAVVPLPSLSALQPPPSPWPTEQLFSDVDIDLYNRSFFAAVDNFLAPESAAEAFEKARPAYTTIAQGRESLAFQYGRHEVDWMFDDAAPFSGTQAQLDDGRETFEQQMRAALMTAYSMDTIVQFPVVWNSTVPSAADDMISLFGQIVPVGGDPVVIQNSKLSAAHVDVRAGGTPGLLTFLYGTPNIQDTAEVSLDLVYNVTHVEYYLEPASQTPPDTARPSIWLQLVNPYPNGLPHLGPQGQETNIPLVFRQYPTPPTVLTQTGVGGASSQGGGGGGSTDPLVDAASWHFTYSYQSQITAHDRILSTVTYNTDLRVSSSGGGTQLTDEVGTQAFSLFEALARFNATYAVLLPILTKPADPNWATAAGIFADRVGEVVNNTDWNPPPPDVTLFGSTKPQQIDNNYIVTDPPPQEPTDPRTITLTWDAAQQNVSDAISVLALDPTGVAYPNQQPGTVPNGVTDIYTPNPAIVDDWVVHQVEMDGLNVLLTENALTGVQIQRNLIVLPSTGTPNWTIKNEFVYKTPLVRPSQPVTPFIDSSTVIDVASLPNQGQSATCPPSPSSLCQRIYTMMHDLIANPDHMTMLRAFASAANADDDSNGKRRVKVACGFQYPVSSAVVNQPGQVPISPLIPIALARSFDVDIADPPQTDELNQFASQYTQAIQSWSANNGITFGPSSTLTGACLVFDITLYAQLSGLNTPVLRLRNLQLKLTDVDPL